MLIDSLGYRGGAERQFAGLAMSLHQQGLTVKILAYHNHDGYQNELKKAGVPFEIIQNVSGRIKKLMAIKRQLSIENPDIVITYKGGPNLMACLFKALGAKWKLIVSDRNTLQEVSGGVKMTYKWFYRFADAIVPNSYSQRDFIVKHFPKLENKICVITNFTDTDNFHPNLDKINNSEKKAIVTAARITTQKNVTNYIEAVNILKQQYGKSVNFFWYGRFYKNEDDYASLCKLKIKEYNLQDTFRFMPYEKNIEEIYRRYDYFCLPSLWEGYPNALCEAMASGMIVAASRICDNEKIISDGENGFLFNQSSPQDMAATLNMMISLSQDEMKRISANARKFTLENLSVKEFTDKYITLMHTLLD